jgi:hypothetical protein
VAVRRTLSSPSSHLPGDCRQELNPNVLPSPGSLAFYRGSSSWKSTKCVVVGKTDLLWTMLVIAAGIMLVLAR